MVEVWGLDFFGFVLFDGTKVTNHNEGLALLHLYETSLFVNRKPKWFSCSRKAKVVFPVLCGAF